MGRNDRCYGGASIRNLGARCAMMWPCLGNGNCSAANECVSHTCLFQGARRCQIENTYLLYSKIPFNCLAIISVPNQNESPATPQKDPQTTPRGATQDTPSKGSSQEKMGDSYADHRIASAKEKCISGRVAPHLRLQMESKMNWGWGATPPLIHFVSLCFLPWSMNSHWSPRTFRASCQERETGVTPSTDLPAPRGNVLRVE